MGESFKPWARRTVHRMEAKDPTGLVRTARKAIEAKIIRREKGTKINDFFWYNFDKKYPGDLLIHISGVGTMHSAKTGFLDGFKDGLNVLADRLEANDPEFEGIKRVVGWSDFVLRNKRAIEQRYGFDVPESEINKDKEGWALAVMEREKFITRPWNRKGHSL
ncbi:MAG: hypothetical protein WA021_02005 [Minisyncoccia bacterium]